MKKRVNSKSLSLSINQELKTYVGNIGTLKEIRNISILMTIIKNLKTLKRINIDMYNDILKTLSTYPPEQVKDILNGLNPSDEIQAIL